MRDKKLMILRQLSEEFEPITLVYLMKKLQTSDSDRTIRRYLHRLVEEGLVKKIGSTNNVKYLAIKSVKTSSIAISSFFRSGSLEVINLVNRPIYEREPVAYNDEWFDSYEPNVSFYLSDAFKKQLEKSGRRSTDHDPAGTYAHQIFNRLLIDLSYNSSRLEGNTYSLLDTERLVLYGDSPEGKLDIEKVMILNHKEAIRYLVDNAFRMTINPEVVFTIHYLLSDGLLESRYTGKTRDHSVRVGGSTYLPFEDPKRLKLQLQQIVNKAIRIQNPFEQSLFLLIHISYLQAFADVNKRTARLVANIPLIIENFVPLSFNDVEVRDYIAAMLAIYEFQDVRPIVDIYMYSYMRTCAAYNVTVQSIGFDEVRVVYRQQRRSLLGEIINKRLIGQQMKEYIQAKAKESIPAHDREAFIKDVMEDLNQMDASRLAGLGVVSKDLDKWLALYKN